MKRAIVLFRNDLRFRDHQPLINASEAYTEMIPVYIFDRPKLEGKQYNAKRINARRLRFILESLRDLNQSLLHAGGKLHVLIGEPVKEVLKLTRAFQPCALFLNKEPGVEESIFEDSLERALPEGVKLVYSFDQTLFHTNDLPFDIENLPTVFTDFRKTFLERSKVRELTSGPNAIRVPEGLNGWIPDLTDLGFKDLSKSDLSAFSFKGGETQALKRLRDYIWDSRKILVYKKTRDRLIGENFSSKFSAYLSAGCISPRRIYFEVLEFEKRVRRNDSTSWMIFELMWRDFFKFVSLKHGKNLYAITGLNNKLNELHPDQKKVNAWKKGQTGIPFIDANMRELNETGYMSNRGRQNVAAFFVNDLKQDWREGAAYFEQQLIDYDMASNWGNWAYVAGVGNDPRPSRYFNVISQAKRYDPHGEFVKHWLPELKILDQHEIHEPWRISRDKLMVHNLDNSIYAEPVFISERW